MPPRRWPLYALPTLLLLAWVVLPLVRGEETLYLRDVAVTHLPLKAAQVDLMRRGELPLVDPYRAGGQPLIGNLNAVPLYPDNLLYLVAPTLWAFNAHYWLHLLLAVPAMYALGRAFSLSRRGAWAAGVVWGTSGYLLSQMNFYNLLGGVVLTPLFIAACLGLSQGRRPRRRLAAAAALWALLLLAGDPMTALVALLLAASAMLVRGNPAPATAPVLPATGRRPAASRGDGTEPGARRESEGGDEGERGRSRPLRRGRRWLGLTGALALGTTVALPQIVETARVLPGSFRGAYGYSLAAATLASWDPRQLVEWLLPFPFGRLDLLGDGAFWGQAFYTGTPPYFLSLYPGLAALALVAAAGRPRGRGGWWAWGAVGAGLFIALGRFNPAAEWLFALPGLRYPVKLWLAVAVGASVLAGWGFEAAFVDRPRRVAGSGGMELPAFRRFAAALGLVSLVLTAAWSAARLAPGRVEGWLAAVAPAGRGAAFASAERQRLEGLLATSLAVALALLLAAWIARRKPVAAPALLLVHAAAQLALLQPLLSTDAALPYQTPPPILDQLPTDALVAHGSNRRLFGGTRLYGGDFPEASARWLTRRAYYELYPFAGILWQRHYAFDPSPEGLDSLRSRLALEAVKGSEDRPRLALLAASGVTHLLLDRPLAAEAMSEVRQVATLPSFGDTLHLYELRRPAAAAALLGAVRPAVGNDEVYDALVTPGFDPRRTVVVEGVTARDGPPGTVRILDEGPDHLAAEVESPAGGVLLLRRAWLDLYQAEVDGQLVPPRPANLQRLGIEVPAGRHRVRLWIDRRPTLAAAGVAGLAVVVLAGLAFAPARRRRSAA